MNAIKPLGYWRTEDAPVEAMREILSLRARFAHWVPTENLISSPRHAPFVKYARMVYVAPDTVRKLTGMNDAAWPDRYVDGRSSVRNDAVLVESYSDWGNDGHTNYCLTGLVLIRNSDAEALKFGATLADCPLFEYEGSYYETPWSDPEC